jgi:phosphotransferase system enzyme I (PtsI)
METKGKEKGEQILSGTPISNGLSVGMAFIVPGFGTQSTKPNSITADEVREEIARVKQAMQILLVVCQCSEDFLLQNGNSTAADIFAIQRAFLEDPYLKTPLYTMIEKKHYNAETAIRLIFDDFTHGLSTAGNQRVRERSADITDLKNMLLDALNNPLDLVRENHGTNEAQGRIAIAKSLTPRLIIEQNLAGIKGIVAEEGGRTSHAAILCQALGIPTISGIENATTLVQKNRKVLIDGTRGTLVISPSAKTIYKTLYENLMNRSAKHVVVGMNSSLLQIMATISFARESRSVARFQVNGIGLYRTEMEFIAMGRLLTEEEQLYRYIEVLENMDGSPVYLRLLDIGGDKKIGDLEETSTSKSRGAQYLIENPEILKTQARAIARASLFGPVNVVYPMIADLNQFQIIKNIFQKSIAFLKTGTIRHGVMIELPSACHQASELLKEADFASIGTNDLIEHLFDFNRNSEQAYHAASHPALWDMIELVMKAAREFNRTVLLCGEMAKRVEYLHRYVQMGISTISVPLESISAIRQELSSEDASVKKTGT